MASLYYASPSRCSSTLCLSSTGISKLLWSLLSPIFLSICVKKVYNVVYSVTVEPVYSVITWKSVSSYVWVVVAIAAVIGMHFLGRLIWERCKKPRYDEELERRRENGEKKGVGWV
jgi:hypothetical protein